jgi:hypothetical protein
VFTFADLAVLFKHFGGNRRDPSRSAPPQGDGTPLLALLPKTQESRAS